MKFLIVSGLSGAGKSLTARLLEDMGYYCVDNMPPQLIPSFAELCLASQGQYRRVALVTDVRAGQTFSDLFIALDKLREMGCDYKIIFVEASHEIIVRRYKETRRPHPLAVDGESLSETIAREELLLEPIRRRTDITVHTSDMPSRHLERQLRSLLGEDPEGRPMSIIVRSFGYKHGLPRDSDLVFDARFLPNPFYVPELRDQTGEDGRVRDYVLHSEGAGPFIAKLGGMLAFLLPLYASEGKTMLVVSVGCTGGRHRSVAVARRLYEEIQSLGYPATLTHRDIGRA
ncbi:MAG: RNase adapter RapZ [Oscillospiraceae bacterium]|nr:RNase adapter RapZ [Oscillospiraceae bacterium]